MISIVDLKLFQCDYNAYEDTKDGLITATEFTKYAKKHGYDEKQSQYIKFKWYLFTCVTYL